MKNFLAPAVVVHARAWAEAEEVAVKLRRAAKHRNMNAFKEELRFITIIYCLLHSKDLSWDLKRFMMLVIIKNGGMFDQATGEVYNDDKSHSVVTLAVIQDVLDPDFEPFTKFNFKAISDEFTDLISKVGSNVNAIWFITPTDWLQYLAETRQMALLKENESS